ncbi:MAG: toxin VasX [Halomonas sp.]|uniref:toxin VasX n=1 Tax=Halomonas sp. TaxID=1486246 RepID=UPI003F914BD1
MSQGDLKELQDEEVDLGVRRRVEYEDDEDGTLALVIPKREGGGDIEIPLVEHARTVFERTDGSMQDNTMLAVRPLAEVGRNRPVQQRGVTTYTGIATAMLRPGYLYVFFENRLWRELEVGPDGKLSDVDIAHYREQAEQGATPNERDSEGEWLDDILLPAMLQGQATLHKVRLAYSEIAWSWPYITWLEANASRLETRTTAVNHAHAVILDMEGWLSMQTGFPAGSLADQPALRERDLGIELMLEAPETFTTEFTAPSENELCAKLKALWEQAGEADRAATLALECGTGSDLLEGIRSNTGIVAVALPDPLFAIRHALSQLQLIGHYLDGLDSQLNDKPLAHSAKLVRQALYDVSERGEQTPLAEYRDTIDQEKLHEVLDQDARDYAVTLIQHHIGLLEQLLDGGRLIAVIRDYTSHHGLGICEAYALCGDLLSVLQQLPGILREQGAASIGNDVKALLNKVISSQEFQALWSANDSDAENDGSGNFRPSFLQQLAEDNRDIDETSVKGLGIESLGVIAQNLSAQESIQHSDVISLTNTGKISGLISTIVGQWSQAVLRVLERVSDDIEVVHLQRIFTALGDHANMLDGNLNGQLLVMRRNEVDFTRYSIIGVHGEGLNWGLTDQDRSSGVMQTRRDYLYAEQVDPRGNVRTSTSPSRMTAEVDDAIRRVAGEAFVFVLPAGHSEAIHLSQLRLAKLAGQAKVVVDGSAVSRVLVGFAIYNLGREIANAMKAYQNKEFTGLELSKMVSSLVDLSAASMKLHAVLYPTSNTPTSKLIQRAWFDVKSWPVIGTRLSQVGASTLVRTLGLFNFFAGIAAVGVSSWELRNSLQYGEKDAAIGHSIAVAGGALFLAAPLMTGLLLIPGWGWALLGLGLAIGGSSYAAMNQDTSFEKLLKRGPLGTHTNSDMHSMDDHAYYPQLLTQLSPVEISVMRYGALESNERQALLDSVWEAKRELPGRQDYVVTISTPLISRYKIGESLMLAVQELEQTDAGVITPMGDYSQLSYITGEPQPFQIGKRQLLPEQSAVRFLVKRKVTEQSTTVMGNSITSTSRLRVAMQARVEWELGEMVLPTPMLDQYEAYSEEDHGAFPERDNLTVDNPFDALIRYFSKQQGPQYWYTQEFQV